VPGGEHLEQPASGLGAEVRRVAALLEENLGARGVEHLHPAGGDIAAAAHRGTSADGPTAAGSRASRTWTSTASSTRAMSSGPPARPSVAAAAERSTLKGAPAARAAHRSTWAAWSGERSA